MLFDNQNIHFDNNDISNISWIDYHQQGDKVYDSTSMKLEATDFYNYKHNQSESSPPTEELSSKSGNSTTSKPDKLKRKQVKNACVNCQKACKKCDDGRPCKRCVKLGLTSTCRDSDRKERKKGVKRGPYKKRQTFNKDKPAYPKLTDEWKPPIYENVRQVLSHNAGTWPSMVSPLSSNYYEDTYFPVSSGVTIKQEQVPVQQLSSPTSYTSYESDELMNFSYGYGYTNTNTTAISSPSSISMLGHNSFSDNVTPIQNGYYSWDDPTVQLIENVSPIGCDPIEYTLPSHPSSFSKMSFPSGPSLTTYPINSQPCYVPMEFQQPPFTVPSTPLASYNWPYPIENTSSYHTLHNSPTFLIN